MEGENRNTLHKRAGRPKSENVEMPEVRAARLAAARKERILASAASMEALPLTARADETLLSFDELRPLGIHYGRVHLRRLEGAGKFPQRVRLSERRVAWRVADIRQYLTNLRAGG